MKAILAAQGVRGLFQGHLATLLRIFPYAGVKFMAYDKVEGVSFESQISSLSGFPGRCRTGISSLEIDADTRIQFWCRS